MIQQDLEVLQNVSRNMTGFTVRLQYLSQQKLQFVNEIEEKIDQLYQKISQNFINRQVTLKNFSQRYGLKQQYLSFVLFHQHQTEIQILTLQRLYEYLKISKKNSRRKCSINTITQNQVKRFVQIVGSQIQILAEIHSLFVKYRQKIDKIFEEIDFFNNHYIDCTSLSQFFRHYSPDQIFQEKGCILLIQMIKGSENSSDKLFYKDLTQLIDSKNFKGAQQRNIPSHLSQKQLPQDSLKKDLSYKKRFLSVQQQKNFNNQNFIRTMMLKQKSKQKQSSPDRSIQQSVNEQKLMDLSMSQSLLSPQSPKNKNNPKFDIIFHSIPSDFNTKNEKTQEEFSIQQVKMQSQAKDPKLIDQSDYIKVQDQYQFKKKPHINSEQNAKQKFSIFQEEPLQAKFKGFYQQKLQLPLNTNMFKQTKKIYEQNNRNTFETNLIRHHSRNSAYLARVKLISDKVPKLVQDNRHSKSKQKSIGRPCLSGKISVFEKKKVELIYCLQFLSAEYEKWCKSIVDLITQNDKFNFTNAFNVIDMKETNNVTFFQFLQFLSDCKIEKIPSRLQLFFEMFSTQRSSQNKEDGPNKENIQHDKQYQLSQMNNEDFQKTKSNKVMKYSNFLKIFCVNKALPVVKKCKQRSAKVQMTWDDKMRKNYCHFLRIIIDSVYSIQNMKRQTKKTYIQMRQIWKEQAFQKTFGRQILRFEEMQKLLKCNCSTFLCEISKDDQYIDEQKLFKYFSIEQSEIY